MRYLQVSSGELTSRLNLIIYDIWEGRIVWIRGPFEPATHDISVFHGGEKEVKKEDWDRNALYFQVKEGDLIVGDSGYAGEPSKIVVWRDEHTPKYKKFLARVASRQETVFKGLKDWKILKHRFAYGNTTKERMKLHKMAVEAIAVIRQPRYSKEEFARRGDDIYESQVRPKVGPCLSME